MKRVLLALMALAFCLPVMAQRGLGLTLHIPFAFEAADRIMPAGDYRVSSLPSWPGLVLVEDQNLESNFFVITTSLSADAGRLGETYLAFNRYEDRYFMARVAFLDRNCQVVKSRSERVLVTSKIVRTGAVRPVEVKIMAAVR